MTRFGISPRRQSFEVLTSFCPRSTAQFAECEAIGALACWGGMAIPIKTIKAHPRKRGRFWHLVGRPVVAHGPILRIAFIDLLKILRLRSFATPDDCAGSSIAAFGAGCIISCRAIPSCRRTTSIAVDSAPRRRLDLERKILAAPDVAVLIALIY